MFMVTGDVMSQATAFEEYFEHMRNPEKCVSIGKALVSKSSFSSKNA